MVPGRCATVIGKLERSVRLAGRFGVAGVANDGSTTGLSADGRVLVLAGMLESYPQRRTTLVASAARRLVARARIVLPGFYTVDAISPSGRWLYLIHYLSPNRDILRYEVRAEPCPCPAVGAQAGDRSESIVKRRCSASRSP